MKDYAVDKIRNVALCGHGSSGKTSLTAALLFDTGATNRLLKVDKGNTVTDYDPDEIERKISINATPCYCEWKDHKVNVIDTPGYSNFLWDTRAALRAVDGAAVVIDAVAGVEVGTEKVWEMIEARGLPRIFVINKMDRENANFGRALDSVREFFGRQAVPVLLPIGEEKGFAGVVDIVEKKAYTFEKDESGKMTEGPVPAALADEVEKRYKELLEMVAESDEKLMEKYFETGALSAEEFRAGLKKSILNNQIFPVFAASGLVNIGAQTLLWDSLMSTIVPPVLDEHTAFALERNLGRRRGNYGEYLLDLPAETRLRVLDTAGQPVSGAEVHVYQVTYDYQWMDQDLRFAGSTDVAGEFSLGGEPYGPISVIGNNAVLFITAYARGQEDHFWLDVPTVNLVYWKGQTDTAVIPLQSHIPPAGVPLPTAPVVQTKVVGRQVWLDWTAEPDLTYDVYRASTPNAYYQQILTGTAATTYTEFFDPYLVGTETARYAVRAISPAGHPSALGTAGASVLVRPEGIAVNAAGQRLVLDNHHMEALFQRPDGAFVGQATSTEEWSSERYDLTLDPQGYVYLQSADLGRIHVFDPAYHLLGVLADNLAGSRGLAYQGEGYQVAHDITGLPEPDSLTLLLAYLDGDLAGQAGEEGFGTKVTFAPGYHDLGASLTSTAVLTYPVTGNIQAASGSVEMWLRPLWDGDDGGNTTVGYCI